MSLNFLTDAASLQRFMNQKFSAGLAVDGKFGQKSMDAARAALIKAYSVKDRQISSPYIRKVSTGGATDQEILTGLEQYFISQYITDPKAISAFLIDGAAGPVTKSMLEIYQNAIRDQETPAQLSPTPVAKTDYKKLYQPNFVPPDFGTEKTMRQVFGNPADAKNLVTIDLPFPLRLDWDLKTTVNRMTCHKLIAPAVLVALNRILVHYGIEKIRELGLDQFAGCYNARQKMGGTSWSMHAWGAALDWDADRNPLRASSKTARFAVNPETHAFLDIWESVGFTSLGRARNYDWMHVQAPRL